MGIKHRIQHKYLQLRTAIVMLMATVVLVGCGTSTVNLVVVRPAPINTRAYGGTVSVGAITPVAFDLVEVSGQLRQEVMREILNGVAGVVRLMDFGGGLTITGRLDEYAPVLRENRRADTCRDTVQTTVDGKLVAKQVSRPCEYRWYDWTARVAVTVQISAANGQVIVLKPVWREASGRSGEVRDAAPPLPILHSTLQQLRHQVAEEIAWLVVPHRERVNVMFYDCDEPAKAVCESALRAMSSSDYDGAVASYTQALGMLEQAGAPSKERAEVFWNRGLVFQYSHRYDEARADFIRADQLDPRSLYSNQVNVVERERNAHAILLQEGLIPVSKTPAPSAPKP